MLVLSEAEVRALLPAADLIDVMEQALAAFSSGQFNQLFSCLVMYQTKL